MWVLGMIVIAFGMVATLPGRAPPGYSGYPKCSPDGRTIVFHHANRTSGEGAHVYVMDFDGKFTRIDVAGATETGAYEINAAGQIVGGFTDARGKRHGYILGS